MNSPRYNFSGISFNTVIGRLLRLPLSLIPRNTRLPILQGALKGKKWIVGSGTHGCWLGSYEYNKQLIFTNTIKKGSVVYDIGAHAGFYTLLASELTGPNGKVISFEPSSKNIGYLREHLKLNRCSNVQVIEKIVIDKSGTVFFDEGANSYYGHVSPEGLTEVTTTSLDDIVSKGDIPPPDYIKIDVEGAEMSVLSGAKKMLRDFSPVVFLATHGQDLHQKCCSLLRSSGYDVSPIKDEDIDTTDEILAFRK
jgi:FkbM family methyltransferase